MILTAFRRPGGAVASPQDVSKAVAFNKRFPGISDDDWTYLLNRLHCMALGESIEERRRKRDWPRAKFQDGWRRARGAIVDGLNLPREANTAALLAGSDAEDRLERQGRIVVDVARGGYRLTS